MYVHTQFGYGAGTSRRCATTTRRSPCQTLWAPRCTGPRFGECLYACICVGIDVFMYVYTYFYRYIYVCVYIYIYIYDLYDMYVCMYVSSTRMYKNGCSHLLYPPSVFYILSACAPPIQISYSHVHTNPWACLNFHIHAYLYIRLQVPQVRDHDEPRHWAAAALPAAAALAQRPRFRGNDSDSIPG